MRTHILIAVFSLASAFAADLSVPSVTGALSVDGMLDEPLWQQARALPLAAPAYPAPLPAGGEARIAVCGEYLCLAARLPEPGRMVAVSLGRNPSWFREDQVVWTFRVRVDNQNRALTLTVNPLGAWSWEPAKMEGVLVAARVAAGEWTAEAAIPLRQLAAIGFVGCERVRAARPGVPELRWSWPAANDRATFELPSAPSAGPAPALAPEPGLGRQGAAPALTGLAAELAALPASVWSDAERAKRETALLDNLHARMAAAAQAERLAWEKVRTRADWERFRDTRIAALRASLGPFPERTPLRAAVTRRADISDGFAIENVVFESRPGLPVTANLYLPVKLTGRIPAIVMVHSHHNPKTQSELQDIGMTWARAGAAVLVMDQMGAGERVETQAWPRESYHSRYALGMQMYLAGETLIKWMAWDLMRGIDLLLERPYIDPRRVVMIGSVAGGGDPAAVTAALDPRVAAVIPFNFGEASPEGHYTTGPRPYDAATADPGWGEWESTRNLYRSAAQQFFPWLICVSVAPRPFVFAFEVGWPKTVAEEPIWARYQKVYELYGQPGKLAEVSGFGPFQGPGECNNVGSYLRRRIYPILKKWLDVPVPAEEYHNPRPDAELMALTPSLAAARKFQPASALAAALARERLAKARANPARLRAALAAKLGDIEPPARAAARVTWTKEAAGFSAEGIALEVQANLEVPLVLLKPRPAARVPVVLVFAQEGKAALLAARAPEIARLVEAGAAVCLADVRGTGEAARRPSRGPGGMSAAATELMLEGTLPGARLRDARAVFRYLAQRPDIDPKRIVLWGDSLAPVNPRDMVLYKSAGQPAGPDVRLAEPLGGMLALLTALYEPDAAAVASRRGLASFLSVLEDRFAYVPLDVIVPGLLEAGDLPDVAAAIAPRPVLIAAPVDGCNRPVGAEDADPRAVAEWIAARLR